MHISQDEFKNLRQAGYSIEKIAEFSRKRDAQSNVSRETTEPTPTTETKPDKRPQDMTAFDKLGGILDKLKAVETTNPVMQGITAFNRVANLPGEAVVKVGELATEGVRKLAVEPLTGLAEKGAMKALGVENRPEEYPQALRYAKEAANVFVPEIITGYGAGTLAKPAMKLGSKLGSKIAKIPEAVIKKGSEVKSFIKGEPEVFTPEPYTPLQRPLPEVMPTTTKDLDEYIKITNQKKGQSLKALTDDTKEVINNEFNKLSTEYENKINSIIEKTNNKKVDFTDIIEKELESIRDKNGVVNTSKVEKLIEDIPVFKNIKDDLLDDDMKFINSAEFDLRKGLDLKHEIDSYIPASIKNAWKKGQKGDATPAQRRLLEFQDKVKSRLEETYENDYKLMNEEYKTKINPLKEVNKMSGKKLEQTILNVMESRTGTAERTALEEALPKSTLNKFDEYKKLVEDIETNAKKLSDKIKLTDTYKERLAKYPSENARKKIEHINAQAEKEKLWRVEQDKKLKARKRKLVLDFTKALALGGTAVAGGKIVNEIIK
jgi:hypothetical protein